MNSIFLLLVFAIEAIASSPAVLILDSSFPPMSDKGFQLESADLQTDEAGVKLSASQAARRLMLEALRRQQKKL